MPGFDPRLDDGDRTAVAAEFEAVLGRLPSAMAQAGHALLARLATPNWALEWGLPRWLGRAMGLPEDLIRELVASNLFGLATARMVDDLVDGEVPAGQGETATLLATAMHGEWLRRYVRLFAGVPAFWTRHGQIVNEWLGASVPEDAPPDALMASGNSDALLWFARRGAPLKLCGVGACLLGKREASLPAVEAAVDRLLVAGVLLDHAQDWAGDLEAGRYNALVATYGRQGQLPEHREANRQAVLEALLLGDGAEAYWRLVQGQIETARGAAVQIPCPDLVEYLDWFSERAQDFGQRLVAAYRAWLRERTEQIFGIQD